MTAFSVPANLAFDTYGDLIASLNSWLDREDLTGDAPAMIALAEDDMIIELEPLMAEVRQSVACVDGAVVLPTDYGMLIVADYAGTALPQVSPAMGREYVTGPYPQACSVEAGQLRVWPSTNATLTLTYRPKLVRLSEGTQTNTLLQTFPSIYFYGALAKAGEFINSPEVISYASARFESLLARAAKYYTRQRHGGPLVPRVAWLP